MTRIYHELLLGLYKAGNGVPDLNIGRMTSPSSLAYQRLMALTSLPRSSTALTGLRLLETWIGTRIPIVQRRPSMPGGLASCPSDRERFPTCSNFFWGDLKALRPIALEIGRCLFKNEACYVRFLNSPVSLVRLTINR